MRENKFKTWVDTKAPKGILTIFFFPLTVDVPWFENISSKSSSSAIEAISTSSKSSSSCSWSTSLKQFATLLRKTCEMKPKSQQISWLIGVVNFNFHANASHSGIISTPTRTSLDKIYEWKQRELNWKANKTYNCAFSLRSQNAIDESGIYVNESRLRWNFILTIIIMNKKRSIKVVEIKILRRRWKADALMEMAFQYDVIVKKPLNDIMGDDK